MTQPTDPAPDPPTEWDSGAEERAAAARVAAAEAEDARKLAAERRAAWGWLGLVILAACATGVLVAVLAIDNPDVAASIEGELPVGPIELAGEVTSEPTLVTLGGVELSWDPYGPGPGATVAGQTIWLEARLSKGDCKRLSQIGGACGADQAPPLGGLESLQVEAVTPRLYASLGGFSAGRSILEAHYETSHEGAVPEWTMQGDQPSLTLQLSCGQPPLELTVTTEPKSLAAPKLTRSVTCLPNGMRYRLGVRDQGAAMTSVDFNRVLHFQAKADAREGAMTLKHGTKAVDGGDGPLPKSATVELAAAGRSTVSSQVVSPAGESNAEVTLETARATHAVIDGEETTPNELERLPALLTGILVSWGLFLLGVAGRLILKLRPRRRKNA